MHERVNSAQSLDTARDQEYGFLAVIQRQRSYFLLYFGQFFPGPFSGLMQLVYLLLDIFIFRILIFQKTDKLIGDFLTFDHHIGSRCFHAIGEVRVLIPMKAPVET